MREAFYMIDMKIEKGNAISFGLLHKFLGKEKRENLFMVGL